MVDRHPIVVYNAPMTTTISTVKTASKDILARAMAQEDITVQHSAQAQTASFDTQSRVLTLPVWEDMDDSMYDMLVGHEVSHALHTPTDGWMDWIGNGPDAPQRMMFLNIIEDDRIERMIKAKFPGLRRDFAAAYKSLQDKDIFELNGKNIADLPLIDRLNLESKIGTHCQAQIPFTTDEQQYVGKMHNCQTFEEVMDLAAELYDMWKDEQDQQNAQQDENGESAAMSSDGDDEQGEGTGESSASSESNDQQDGEGQSSGSNGDDEQGEDSGASMHDDTDDGESAESTDGENQNGDQQGGLEYDDYSNNYSGPGTTQRSFEKSIKNMQDSEAGQYNYSTLPDPILKNIVVDHTDIAKLWDNVRSSERWNDKHYTDVRTQRGTELRTFQNSIKATVNQMVQHFLMKQAADADKRTEIAKTGVLDTVSMINYRWSEDIFLKNEVHPDGKNHGMIMYLDWSGSMGNILQDTVEQLLVLTEFCRKVNIPFEVYAFSSQMYCPVQDRYSDEYQQWHDNNQKEQWDRKQDSDCTPHPFQLYNFLSSRMNKRQYADALNNLWLLTGSVCYYGGHPSPNCLSLGCTPLHEAMVCALQQIPAFQQQNQIQIVNAVFLTDGDGHSMVRNYYRYNDKNFITDHKTKKNYEITNRGEKNALLQMLKDRTGCNTIGIRLHDQRTIKNMRYTPAVQKMNTQEFEKQCKQYNVQNYATFPSAYDEYFIVKGNLKVETDALENLDTDASYTKIKNAFIKGGSRKKSSRVIATKMVEIFAA